MWTISLAVTTGTLLALIAAFFFSKKGTTLSLAIGVAFSILLGLLIYGLLIYGFRIELFAPSWISKIFAQVTGAVVGFQLFRFGSIVVPTKHRAVITVLEERRGECPTLHEGAGWLFPGIMDAIAVDARDFNIDLAPFEVLSKELIRVQINLSIVLAVDCPNSYLNVDDGENIIQQLARRAARVCANDISVQEIAHRDAVISDAVREEIQAIVNDWGLVIRHVRTENISPPEEITNESQRIEIERIQRDVEKYEIETFEQKVSILMKKFGRKGMTPEKAANLIQAESGKITRTAFDLEGINTGEVVQAIIAVVDAIKDKSEKGDAS